MSGRRWVALVVLVAIGIGLLVAIVAKPWDDGGSTTVPTVYRQGDTISVAKGDEFVIALPATPSIGYAWTAGNDPGVTVVSSKQVAGGSRPGASGTRQLTFRSVAPGA